jgi:ABC-2 type transport system ATP-binding protein
MIIEIENLKKTYFKKTVLNISSLHIAKGEKIAITGPNGSGKSTLLHLALDLIEPDEGRILLFGNNVRDNEKWKFQTSAFLNDSFLLDFLTVREYIHFLVNSVTVEHINEMLYRLGFTTLNLNEHIKNLSSGNKKKVGILGALLSARDLIIFDEVCNFLDYESKKGLIDYFKSLTDCTVVIAEHNLGFIQDFASRVLVLDNGVIIKDIKVGDILPQNLENLIHKP